MFLLNELLVASPLLIYVGFRLRKLIARRFLKNAFTVFFLLLVLAYPLAEDLSHRSANGWALNLSMAGYYALPLLLYLVLIIIPCDIIIGLLRLLKVISRETVRSSCFRLTRLCLMLAVPAMIVAAGILNYHHLRIQEYSIEVPRKSSEIKQLRIVFAADFHLGQLTGDHFMESFVAKVNALNPDIVLIGGDVLEDYRQDEETDRFAALFRKVQSKFGLYGVPGNHEGYRGITADFFLKAGIRLLQDEVEKIDGAFYLAGRNDRRSRSKKSVAELLRNTPDDRPVILLDHRPVDFDQVSNSHVDIQFSGHTHHGQLFPLNFITQRRYELSWGYKKKRQTHFFVTSGVQIWGPPVRTAGASEILVVDVSFHDPG